MGKMSLTGASLAASIPAGILVYVLLMAVINNLNDMPTLLKGVVLVALAVALAVALFSLYLLIWYRSSYVVVPRDKTKAAAEPVLAAAAVGGGELADSFLDEFGHSDSEFEADRREEEAFGGSDEFATVDDDSFEEGGFDAEQTVELNQDLSEDDFLEEFGGGDSNATLEFETDESLIEAEVDEFSATLPVPGEDDDSDLLAGEAIDDDFNFELFEDDEDDKKK